MNDNKNLLFLTTLISLVFGLISPLVVWIMTKSKLEGDSKDYLKNLLNFEITMFIIGFVFGIVFAPLAGFCAFINLVVLIFAMISVYNNKNFKFPFLLDLIK